LTIFNDSKKTSYKGCSSVEVSNSITVSIMHHNQPLECNGEDYTGDFLVNMVWKWNKT